MYQPPWEDRFLEGTIHIIVLIYSLCSAILDFHVSRVSDQIAVMTGKDVIILSVVKSEEERRASQMKQGRKKAVKDLTDLTFLPREQVSEKIVHNEFVISQVLWFHPRHGENLYCIQRHLYIGHFLLLVPRHKHSHPTHLVEFPLHNIL